MKKAIALLLVCLLCFGMAAAEGTGEWSPELFSELTGKYASVLDDYAQAIREQWDVQTLYDHDLCPLLYNMYNELEADAEPGSNISYGFARLGEADAYQLIIYVNGTDEYPADVLQIYETDADGRVVLLATGAERCSYTLCDHGEDKPLTVVCTGANSAFESFKFTYTVENHALKMQDGILMVWDADDHGTVYLCRDEDFDTSNDTVSDWTYADAYFSELAKHELTALDLWATMADYIAGTAVSY